MQLPFSTTLVTSLAQPTIVSVTIYINAYFPAVAPTTIPPLYFSNETTLGAYTSTTSSVNYVKDPLVMTAPLTNITVAKLPDEFYT